MIHRSQEAIPLVSELIKGACLFVSLAQNASFMISFNITVIYC